MPEQVKYDYTGDELRDTLKWKLQKANEDDTDVLRAVEALTDDVILMLEAASKEWKDDFQLQVAQYREAKRRGQVK